MIIEITDFCVKTYKNICFFKRKFFLYRSDKRKPEEITEILKSLQDFKTKNEEELFKISINEKEDEKTLTRSKFHEEGTLTNTNKNRIQVGLVFH